MAQLVTVRLDKSDHQPLGFRLQGGKDFGTPLVVQKVNGGSAAERAGLQAGDALIRVNSTDVYTLRHQEAQDTIRAAGPTLELVVQRGGSTWRPSVTPTGSLPRPGRALGGAPTPVTATSLKATPQPSRAFGSGHNSVAKPFGYMNGGDAVKGIVNKQYNTPVNMYSEQSIAETLSAQTEVLAGGVLGVNFKKNEKTYDAEKSAVFKMLQEDQSEPEPEAPSGPTPPVTGLRHVPAPVARPEAPINNTGGLPPGQNICEECERLITGVFVRIKDKNLHVECFKCSTCGTSLKNQGYYNLNGKLYCDIHAKLVARQNPPAPHLEPVTVPPGSRIPTNTYSTPLPPLATNSYTNGSSLFSPSSNLSGPKPFGSSIGSAYSPSLSPRSAPLSPARPVVAPAPVPAPAPAPAPTHAPVHAPFAPTNDTQIASASPRTEYKSPAEERLMRKMAKMALNGYEIGIQRKIKPADHIQSMADKIQDTVVTKHPLNSDGPASGDSSRENTLKRPSKIPMDRGYKVNDNIQNIGDRIKETIVSNHPTNNFGNGNAPVPPPIPSSPLPVYNFRNTPINNVNTMNTFPRRKPDDYSSFSKISPRISPNDSLSDMSDDNIPIPPPIPTTPIPTSNAHSTPIKILDDITDSVLPAVNKQEIRTQFGHGKENYGNGNLSRYNDRCKINENRFDDSKNNGSVKNNIFEKTTGFNDHEDGIKLEAYKPEYNNFSNTLKKKNMFEKLGARNGNTNMNEPTKKVVDKNVANNFNNNIGKNNIDKSNTIVTTQEEIVKDDMNKSNLPSNLHDNTMYHYREISNGRKSADTKGTTENGHGIIENETQKDERSTKEDTEEVVVRRREKKLNRNDGRRDSHIVARPLSTMTSADVADGMYPVCHKCDKAITRGPFITALGRIWCPEHFICVNASCRRQLQDIGFVEENGQLYCEYCFEQYIAPACDKCHAKIKGDCLNAIGKHFHPECFACVYCGKLFGNNPFFLEDGLPYCEADWNELFTTKCFACGFPVEAGDRWVEALNNNYHSQCFNCTVCKKNLEGQSFFAKGGRPFCKVHAR